MMRRLLLLVTLNLILITALQAEQGAYVLRDTSLLSEPYSGAREITELQSKTVVTILQRRGGWYQARTANRQTGWLRMSTIRLGEMESGSSGVGETLRLLESGRSAASGVTVATGIRGLDAADVANATPNHLAVKRLDRYQTSAARSRSYATEAKLRSQPLSYMKATGPEAIPGTRGDW